MHGFLDELIKVEYEHYTFWKTFFKVEYTELDIWRRIKLQAIVLLCRVFGQNAIHLVLESIESYGIKKYLHVWETYKGTPLEKAVEGILRDEFEHEDAIVRDVSEKKIHPEHVRSIFLGFNDGLVEILGAVSGFFAAFQSGPMVLMAGLTVACAGAISMAAGAYVAESSAREVEEIEQGRKRFLGETVLVDDGLHPLRSAVIVGVSYMIGALVPITPVLFGAHHMVIPIIAGGVTLVVLSYLLSFLSGMDVKKRITTNLTIMFLAVAVAYMIGLGVDRLWGIHL
jgi:predicted membrane protein (TIGR00267 family)